MNRMNVVLASLGIALGAWAAGVVDLNGSWELQAFPQPDDGAVRSLPLPPQVTPKTYSATVPGCCEMELVKAGELPDPLFGFNAFKFRDFEGHQWLYTRRFTAPHRAPGERAVLAFDGIDTLADVFLNGEKKKAYQALKAVYQDVLVMVAEDGRLLAINDTLQPVKGTVKIIEAKEGRIVHEGAFDVAANGLSEVAKLAWKGQGLFNIEYVVGGQVFKTHYLHGEPPFAWTDYQAWMR